MCQSVKIREYICVLRCTAGGNLTVGLVDTGGKFTAGIVGVPPVTNPRSTKIAVTPAVNFPPFPTSSVHLLQTDFTKTLGVNSLLNTGRDTVPEFVNF
jgi:hypothetical protein